MDESEEALTADKEKESNDENSKPSDEVITELDTDKKTLISRDYSRAPKGKGWSYRHSWNESDDATI